MKRKTDLNAALWRAMRGGGKPFQCWGCKGWFNDTNRAAPGRPRTRGRPRTICENPECIKARRLYVGYGKMPGEPWPETKEMQERAVLTRCVLRALQADWLTDIEIAEEFGCSQSFVGDIRKRQNVKRTARHCRQAHTYGGRVA